MRRCATEWLESLRPEQRPAANLRGPGDPESDRERVRWFYTPTDHGGLPLGQQTPRQQQLAMRLVASGLSEAGYNAVAVVMGMENVLDRYEGWRADWGRERGRDPGLYWLRVFGSPDDRTWAWRFGGHHVSLSFAVVDGAVVGTTPCFIGADPARSLLPGGGELGPLTATEDLARRLVLSLDEDQRGRALLHPRAPSDIISGNRPLLVDPAEMMHMNDPSLWGGPFADPRLQDLAEAIDRRAEADSGYTVEDHRQLALGRSPLGVRYADLDPTQRELMLTLLTAYEGRVAEDLRPRRAPSELAEIAFGWAGPTEQGAPHYYRLHGPRVLVEYDNTQRAANHAHSVWRDPMADFGFDAVSAHLRAHHS
jgi:hypothetical protein